jgi:hypothetical protein
MTRERLNDLSIFAIWELRAAFEEENSSKAIANCNVSVASEWIVTSGKQLYSALNAGPLDEHETQITKGGPLYKGEAGLCLGNFGSYDFPKLRMKWITMSQKWPTGL